MKTITKVFIVTLCMFGTYFVSAQQKCNETLSLFAENIKSKKFKDAKPQLDFLRKNCAAVNSAIYSYGEKLLKHELSNAVDKQNAAKNLMRLYRDRIKNVPARTQKATILTKISEVMLHHDIGTLKEQYDILDEAFTSDIENFKNPRYIYKYFELYYKMYTSAGYTLTLENLIEKYEVVREKLIYEKERLTKIENALQTKRNKNQVLTKKEINQEKRAVKNKEAIVQFLTNMTLLLQKVTTCETLIPMLEKQYETHKENLQWLRKSAGLIDSKSCNDSLFLKLVETIDIIEPTTATKIYLHGIYKQKGYKEKAALFLKQYIELETDMVKKAKMLNYLGNTAAKSGKNSKARTYYLQAIETNADSGKGYLNLARLYASSANECGSNEFLKRATYWKAAETARKALKTESVDKKEVYGLINSYKQAAPSTADIFNQGYKGGEKVPLKCWIGGYVIVPKI